MRLDDFAEGEGGVVEGIDELAHVFDALADGRAVLGEARWGKIARDEAFVDGFGDELAALEREHHAAAEDRIEEGQRIACEDEAGRGAVARVAASTHW